MKNTLRLIFGGFAAVAFAAAAQAAGLVAGTFSARYVVQDVTYKADSSGEFAPLKSGAILKQGAVIRTGGGQSSVEIVFPNGAIASVRPDTEIEISKFEQELFSGALPDAKTVEEPSVSKTKFVLSRGEIVSKVKKLKANSEYTVTTPVGAAGVRGTIFSVAYSVAKRTLTVSTAEGAVEVVYPNGSTIDITNADQVLIVAPDGVTKTRLEDYIKQQLIGIVNGSTMDQALKIKLINTIEHSQIGVSIN
ncbi:MAG: hypothetical protein RIQ79_2056 [Verrucomicrobiota bacterium]